MIEHASPIVPSAVISPGRDDHVLTRAWLAERRALLFGRWRHLPIEDREDLLTQATLECLGAAFASERHARNALTQRFDSRAIDLWRQRHGRGRDAFGHVAPGVAVPERPDGRSAERTVMARETLRVVVAELTPADRALLLAPGSYEARRKRAQRVRARLKAAAGVTDA